MKLEKILFKYRWMPLFCMVFGIFFATNYIPDPYPYEYLGISLLCMIYGVTGAFYEMCRNDENESEEE